MTMIPATNPWDLLTALKGNLTPGFNEQPNPMSPGQPQMSAPTNTTPSPSVGVPAMQQQSLMGRLGSMLKNPQFLQTLAGIALSQGKNGGARGAGFMNQMALQQEQQRLQQDAAEKKRMNDANLTLATNQDRREQERLDMDRSAKPKPTITTVGQGSKGYVLDDRGQIVNTLEGEPDDTVNLHNIAEGTRIGIFDKQGNLKGYVEGPPKASEPEKKPTDVQEYEYAVNNGYKGTYVAWQKIKQKPPIFDLSPVQKNQTFLNISSAYQRDAIVNQSIKGNTADQLADQIIKDPGKATNQLASLYLLVKNLDPDSAVREGELALANQTQSYLQKYATNLKRIGEGQLIAADAAKEMALATKQLVKIWKDTANRKKQQYVSQANTAGVGKEFDDYLKGSESQGTTFKLISNEVVK